jgi:alanine racemase
MQSAFIELGPGDRVGDEVVLLGEGVSEDEVAAAWTVSPQNALLQLAGAGFRRYLE